MNLGVFCKNILKVSLIAYSGMIFASSSVIKDEISSITVNLQSQQVFTMKNHGEGEFKELAFTRIERPSLVVNISDKQGKVQKLEVAIDESLFTAKTSLVNINISNENIVKVNSNKSQALTKLENKGVSLKGQQAASVLKNNIISNLNRLMSRIGFRDQTTIKYKVKNISFECPKLTGRITNCRAKYEVMASINNKKIEDSNLSKIFEDAREKLLSLGNEIQINTYIGELKVINTKLDSLTKLKQDKKKLQSIYVLKKDVQSEILDSYQYTAISTSSAVAFVEKLNKKSVKE